MAKKKAKRTKRNPFFGLGKSSAEKRLDIHERAVKSRCNHELEQIDVKRRTLKLKGKRKR